MSRRRSLRLEERKPKRVHISDEERFELDFKFFNQMIHGFLDASDEFVVPFLKPVDPTEVPDYHSIIQRPMDLSTILRKLDNDEFKYSTDVKACFDRMFANCFRYNLQGSEVYNQGMDFQAAFREALRGKDDWIQAEAEKTRITSRRSGSHDTDDSSDLSSHETSDDDHTEENDSSEEADQQNHTTEPNEAQEQIDATNPPPRSKARNKDGGKSRLQFANHSDSLNFNNKRPLDTTSPTKEQTTTSPHHQALSFEQPAETQAPTSSENQAVSAEHQAKRPRLHLNPETPPSTPIQQQPIQEQPTLEPPTQQQQPPQQSPQQPNAQKSAPTNPLQSFLLQTITPKITALATAITTNPSGTFSMHQDIWNKFYSPQRRDNFTKIWENKVMEKIRSMRVEDLFGEKVDREVELGFKETVEEMAGKVAEEEAREVHRRAAALARVFGGQDAGMEDT